MNAQIDQRPAGRHAFVRKPASALSIGLLRHLSCTMTYHSTPLWASAPGACGGNRFCIPLAACAIESQFVVAYFSHRTGCGIFWVCAQRVA
jgi:hypothetical protein